MKAGRILVVDDDDSSRATLHDCFADIGYEIVEATNGEEALAEFSPGRFDCVISDLNMPGMDGIALLKRIRLLDAQVAFLIVTGFPGIDSAINAMKEGAYDYLIKPFNLDAIQMKVERAIEARKKDLSLKKVRSMILTLIILIPVLISLGIIFGIFWKGM
jgi:DNA-binding NtrC family response regulator